MLNLLHWGVTFVVCDGINKISMFMSQAFLELNSEECAQTMVSYYSSVTPVIRNHPIYMQYSTHKELKTDNSPNQVVRVLQQRHRSVHFIFILMVCI